VHSRRLRDGGHHYLSCGQRVLIVKNVVIALENARLYYKPDAAAALQDVSLSIHEGDRLGIDGDNGSGKTSLLMALTALQGLKTGQLLHAGKAVKTKEDMKALRRDVGLVFQNAEDQLFSLTVIEDVAFGPLNLGYKAETARAMAENMLERMGIADLAKSTTYSLSGGQKRLVALSCTLVMEPKVLLLDEPTNDLDGRGRQKLVDIIKENARTLVVVSHDSAFLEEVTDSRLRMHEGRIIGERLRTP
jgi:cobalt/nickel transport system ATP-binding protein